MYENGHNTTPIGSGFRWRVGVRGGGNNSPSRSYTLAARVCKPTCTPWSVVGDDPNVGIVFLDDTQQDNGANTTNQLTLGSHIFLSRPPVVNGQKIAVAAQPDRLTVSNPKKIR